MANRAPDFRYYFANSLGFSMSDNEVKILFGITEDLENVDSNLEQTGVLMTHKTAKLLAYLLSETLRHYEETTGEEIAFDQTQFESISKALREANQKKPNV